MSEHKYSVLASFTVRAVDQYDAQEKVQKLLDFVFRETEKNGQRVHITNPRVVNTAGKRQYHE